MSDRPSILAQTWTTPAILIAIDNFAEYIESFGQLEKEDDPNNLMQAFVALARQGP